jgi:serine/threonine protein kinase
MVNPDTLMAKPNFVGTLDYLSPEMIKRDFHSFPVDIWAFGIFLFELTYGKTPFESGNSKMTMTRIINCDVNLELDKICEQFIDPKDYEYLVKLHDLFKRIFVFDPKQRITIEDCSKHDFFIE